MHRPRLLTRRPRGIQRLRRLVPNGTQLRSVGSTVVDTARSATDHLPALPGRKTKPRFSRKTKLLGALGLATMVAGYFASRRWNESLDSAWATDPGTKEATDKPSATSTTAAALGDNPALADARDDDAALQATTNPGTKNAADDDETGDGSRGDSTEQ